MYTLPEGLYEFKLNDPVPTCGKWRDHMPTFRDPETYRRYIKARNFWRSKVEFEFTRQELQGILSEITIASEQGDWGARALLAHFYLEGLGPLDTNQVLQPNPEKALQIIRQAVAAGQAWGFHDLGIAYEYGYGGAMQDSTFAWAYYRRAAELGSPDAQLSLADAYEKNKQPDAAKVLRLCAYRQGHGKAALELGYIAEVMGKFAEALRYYQDGTKFGSEEAAAALMLFFRPERWERFSSSDLVKVRALKLRPDPERKKRYLEINHALELNPDLRLLRLDSVLPLPPAELPPWNGVQDAIAPEIDSPPTY